MQSSMRKPEWLNKKIDFKQMHEVEHACSGLHTVCHSARCPNTSECHANREVTYLILGDKCTRNCAFCNVEKGDVSELDLQEPQRLLEAVIQLKTRFAVITSVTRDDLPDGGASVFAECVKKIKSHDATIKVEILVPDFKGEPEAIRVAAQSGADIFGHNVEMVPSLYKTLRPGADYSRSLGVLKEAKKYGVLTKTALLLGFGETKEEVLATLRDIRQTGCDFISIGQYLRPDKMHTEVIRYVHPDEFAEYKKTALETGFKHCESGPYVRSSYGAARYLAAI